MIRSAGAKAGRKGTMMTISVPVGPVSITRLVAGLAIVVVLLTTTPVSARQGCCSWHGGVCACQCCDGSPLSDKCAPYYPECQGTSKSSELQQSPPPTLHSRQARHKFRQPTTATYMGAAVDIRRRPIPGGLLPCRAGNPGILPGWWRSGFPDLPCDRMRYSGNSDVSMCICGDSIPRSLCLLHFGSAGTGW